MMENIAANIEDSEIKPLPVPQSRILRLYDGIVVTLLPFVCFSLIGALKPEWQSGKFSDYVTLFLTPPVSWVFYPLLAYSSVSLLFLLFSPRKYAESFLIRFGIYTGTLLAFQFTLALLAMGDSLLLIILSWVSPFVVMRLYRWLIKGIGAKKTMLILLLFIGLLLFVAYLSTYLFPPFILIAFIVFSAPLWSLLIMGQTSYQLIKHYETQFTLVRGIGLLVWLGGFIAAWRFAVLKTLELYAALPPQPPDCYIATAAANGHPRIVRSHEIGLADGMSMCVNEQLQRLKCAELVLLALAPRVHLPLRKLYDVLGEHLARRMKNPYLSDAAYLLLKPVEWTVILVLNMLVPETKVIVGRFYRSS